MTEPAPSDEDDSVPSREEDRPGLAGWIIGGISLILIYVAALAVLRPTV